MPFARAVFRFIVGVAFGIASAVALTPALAALVPAEGEASGSVLAFFLIVLAAALFAVFAPTIRRAFGRGFLILAASLLALPLSALLLSGRVASDVVSSAGPEDQGAAAVGAGLAGLAITGVATFVGLILGFIMLAIGLVLVLGGRREVVVIERR